MISSFPGRVQESKCISAEHSLLTYILDHYDLTVSNFLENSIGLKRVKGWEQSKSLVVSIFFSDTPIEYLRPRKYCFLFHKVEL